MGILKYSYADKFMFTGLWSGQTFSKLLKVTTLHWAPVSILYETGIPFEGGVTDQSKFSFLIWLIYVEFWILTVSIKIHNRSGQRVHLIGFFQRYVLWDQHVGSKLWNGSFYSNMTNSSKGLHLPRGCEPSQNLHFFMKSCLFWFRVLWQDFLSFFKKILSIPV